MTDSDRNGRELGRSLTPRVNSMIGGYMAVIEEPCECDNKVDERYDEETRYHAGYIPFTMRTANEQEYCAPYAR